MDRVKNLPARLDDETLAKVEQWLARPAPTLPAADRTYVLQFIRLISDMPRRADDEVTGKIRSEAIVEHLMGLPQAQLDWMRREARVRFSFFPSVKELLELARTWKRNDVDAQARRLAEARVYNEYQARLRSYRDKLKHEHCAPEWIEALTEKAKRILCSERLLHRCPDCGTYTQRPGWREYQAFVEQLEVAA